MKQSIDLNDDTNQLTKIDSSPSVSISELLNYSHDYKKWSISLDTLLNSFQNKDEQIKIIIEYCKLSNDIFPSPSIITHIFNWLNGSNLSSECQKEILKYFNLDYLKLIIAKDIMHHDQLVDLKLSVNSFEGLIESDLNLHEKLSDELQLIVDHININKNLTNFNQCNNLMRYITTKPCLDCDHIILIILNIFEEIKNRFNISKFLATYCLKFSIKAFNSFKYKIIHKMIIKCFHDISHDNCFFWEYYIMFNNENLLSEQTVNTLNHAAEYCHTTPKNYGYFCIALIRNLCHFVSTNMISSLTDEAKNSNLIDIIKQTVEFHVERLEQMEKTNDFVVHIYHIFINFLMKNNSIDLCFDMWKRMLNNYGFSNDIMILDYLKLIECHFSEDIFCAELIETIKKCSNNENRIYLKQLFEMYFMKNDPKWSSAFKYIQAVTKETNSDKKNKKLVNKSSNRSSKLNENFNTNDYEPSLTVFLSNLDYFVTEEEIADFFNDNMNIVCKKIDLYGKKRSSKRHSGFGNVVLADQNDHEKALKLDQKPLGHKKRPVYITKYNERYIQNSSSKEKDSKTIFLKNLPKFIKDDEVIKHLNEKGIEFQSLRLIKTKSGKGKGIAYIELRDDIITTRAIECLDGICMGDKRITAQLSDPPKSNHNLAKTDKIISNENFKKKFLSEKN